MICQDANAVCSSDICHCDTGYRNIDDVCRKGELSDSSCTYILLGLHNIFFYASFCPYDFGLI